MFQLVELLLHKPGMMADTRSPGTGDGRQRKEFKGHPQLQVSLRPARAP